MNYQGDLTSSTYFFWMSFIYEFFLFVFPFSCGKCLLESSLFLLMTVSFYHLISHPHLSLAMHLYVTFSFFFLKSNSVLGTGFSFHLSLLLLYQSCTFASQALVNFFHQSLLCFLLGINNPSSDSWICQPSCCLCYY